jgi:predicted nucleic acid-binding protein
MTGFVLDASVALSWCFKDEGTPARLALLQRLGAEHAAVPAVWPLEVANILASAERRKRIDAAGIGEFLALADSLDIRVDSETAGRSLREILDLARREGLTSYDAAYLDLAIREGLPLATGDRVLAQAAERCGVTVLPG